MGAGVARALLAKGFTVYVRDILPERQAHAVSDGAIGCDCAADVARRAPIVITLVVDAGQTRAVLFGADGASEALTSASAVMMCSTTRPATRSPSRAALHPGTFPCSTRRSREDRRARRRGRSR